MMGGSQTVAFGPSDPDTFEPDLDWLEAELQGPNRPKLVYIVNPCNPTGGSNRPECRVLSNPITSPAMPHFHMRK